MLRFSDALTKAKKQDGAFEPDLVIGQADLNGGYNWYGTGVSRTGFARPLEIFVTKNGTLVVADGEGNRVLGWNNPTTNGQAADWVLGQSSFNASNSNGNVSFPVDVWVDTFFDSNRLWILNNAGNYLSSPVILPSPSPSPSVSPSPRPLDTGDSSSTSSEQAGIAIGVTVGVVLLCVLIGAVGVVVFIVMWRRNVFRNRSAVSSL